MEKENGNFGIIASVTLLFTAAAFVFSVTSFWSTSGEALPEHFTADKPDPTINDSSDASIMPSLDGGILSEMVFYGTDSAECIKFGHIKEGGVSKGIGICIYSYTGSACGSYQSRSYTSSTTYDIYKVSALDGDDYVRYSGDEESCGSGWTIDDDMPVSGSGKQQLFWGDGGSDALFTCYSGDSSTCWSNVDRRADGRDGNDIIKGGYYTDTLWGGAGTDEINGYSGNDTLYGWTGGDCLYGGDGVDYLYGEADADWLHGGSGNDYCYCGADLGNDYSCYWTDGNCTDETITDCFLK